MNIVMLLSLLNCAISAIGVAFLCATAIRTTATSTSQRNLLKGVVICSLAVAVLTRGAPHNNEMLFEAYSKYGALFTVSAIILVIAAGVAIILTSRLFATDPSLSVTKWLVAALVLSATLGAAEQVVTLWDAAQWSDSERYEWITVSIARGGLPFGFSYYMPIFQYGVAAFYWAFGHFNFVQQLVNLAMAAISVVFLSLAAWNLFRNTTAVILVALLAATLDMLRYAPHLVQIENWLVPLMCLSIWAVSEYFRNPSVRNAVLLGIAGGIVFETRTQVAFYICWLTLAPFFLSATSLAVRVRHFLIMCSVLVLMGIPWTLRNVLVEHQLSPVGTQTARTIAMFNRKDVLYGVRRDLYRPTSDRNLPEADNTSLGRLIVWLSDPADVMKAIYWRGLAFYGLVPPGIWDRAGMRATTWAEMPEYILRIFPVVALLLASALALVLQPGRLTFFLWGGVAANVAIIIFVGFSEPRVYYPVATLHIILAVAALFPVRAAFGISANSPTRWGMREVWVGIAALLSFGVILTVCHFLYGKARLYPPQTDASLLHMQRVSIDASLVDLNAIMPMPNSNNEFPIKTGMRARFNGVIVNMMLPVKWYLHPYPGFPEFTSDPHREAYFRGYLLDSSGHYFYRGSRLIGIAIAGAAADGPLREGEGVEVEGQVVAVIDRLFWFRAEKIKHLGLPIRGLERFKTN